jgi:pilus assembly protein Flp/PilA
MRRYVQQTEGGTAAEYALILAIVGAAIAASALLLGVAIASAMNNASSTIMNATSTGSSGSSSPSPPAPGTPAPVGPPNAHGQNPNACPGCNSGNGNTDPAGKKV